MRIKAICGQVSKVYGDTDALFGLLKICRGSRAQSKDDPETRAQKAYERIQLGHTVKLSYMGTAVYLRKE